LDSKLRTLTEKSAQEIEQKQKELKSLEKTIAQLHNNNVRVQQEKEQLNEVVESQVKDRAQAMENLKVSESSLACTFSKYLLTMLGTTTAGVPNSSGAQP
jgi:predicted RNA-binding protein